MKYELNRPKKENKKEKENERINRIFVEYCPCRNYDISLCSKSSFIKLRLSLCFR